MLAQNFMTAADLGILDIEHAALIKVLGMLERGELVDVDQQMKCENGFNIGTQGQGCGTPACIGGWAATLMDREQISYVDSYMPDFGDGPRGAYASPLSKLYWGYPAGATVATAAIALRSTLTTGDPRWDLAVAS